ncbi:MAG: CBS domain-containing protein [Bacteroidales bacterium]|nr:CBS domain-containing protein [Bacteroidales bacterium]
MYSVKDILDEKGYEVYTIEPEATVYEALKKMAGQNIGALLVMKDEKVVGVFSERDYARKIILRGKSSKDSAVGELLSERIFYVKPTTTTTECMQIMTDHRVRHLPVLDDVKLVGIVSIGDIVNKTIQGQKKTIQQLEDYILGKTLPS